MTQDRVAIKHGDSFVLADQRGDLPAETETGFYVGGTRHLSAFEVRVDGQPPVLLSSSLSDDDVQLISVQTNARRSGKGKPLPQQSVSIVREVTVREGRLFFRIEVRNFYISRVSLKVEIRAEADFKDIFEIRGYQRAARGLSTPVTRSTDSLGFLYTGLDGVARSTQVVFAPAPDRIDGTVAAWSLVLGSGESKVLEASVAIDRTHPDERAAAAVVRREHTVWKGEAAVFTTGNERVNRLLSRADADLRLMCTQTAEGLVPWAGIPWYACAFGRDSLWTSLMTLALYPAISRGTLRYLARRQAVAFDDFVDSEPGKILHEMRTGEMANLKEIPFIPYYGTVDATPLFVVLLDRHVSWTGDRALLEELWPHAKRALDWVTGPGDLDGDGFVEYLGRSRGGLSNQGWKDSSDSIFHTDGRLAEGKIALVEAQGYAFAALEAGSRLAGIVGDNVLNARFAMAAKAMQGKFDKAFWSEKRQFYAIALDGGKKRCEILSSNPGHALWAGIAPWEHSRIVGRRMLSPEFFSGWGVRTLAEGEARFNPMSYHDGSIWPHDNAILAWGLQRYGLKKEAAQLASAVLESGEMFEDRRIPELFCGFPREEGLAPTPYPVACRPQAWSAATVFALMGVLLGLSVDGAAERVTLDPILPPGMDWVEVKNLAVGGRRVDLRVERSGSGARLASSRGAEVTLRTQGASSEGS